MFIRTDLELMKDKSREEVVEQAITNIENEMFRLNNESKNKMEYVYLSYGNDVLNISYKLFDKEKEFIFVQSAFSFMEEDVTKLHAKLKTKLKVFKTKVILSK